MESSEIGYTTHAFNRMAERDISRSMVEAVIRCGDLERVDSHGVLRFRLEGLVVILDKQDVVTVFFDSDLRPRSKWSPKKRQRKWHQEVKPCYFKGRGKINTRQQDSYLRQMEGR